MSIQIFYMRVAPMFSGLHRDRVPYLAFFKYTEKCNEAKYLLELVTVSLQIETLILMSQSRDFQHSIVAWFILYIYRRNDWYWIWDYQSPWKSRTK